MIINVLGYVIIDAFDTFLETDFHIENEGILPILTITKIILLITTIPF